MKGGGKITFQFNGMCGEFSCRNRKPHSHDAPIGTRPPHGAVSVIGERGDILDIEHQRETELLDEPAKHFDAGKRRWSLLPLQPLQQIIDVFEYGATLKKPTPYGANNWFGGMSYTRMYDSVLRHMVAWRDGEDIDPESRLMHLAHAGCDILMLIFFVMFRPQFDDRARVQKTEAGTE